MDFSNKPYELIGGDGSPYSCKMRAVLRYKRLCHRWSPMHAKGEGGGLFGDIWTQFPDLQAKVIPILVSADGSYANDSTSLIKKLDVRHPHRSVQPSDPAINFLADILEDFGDEWCTKVMFEQRFHTEKIIHLRCRISDSTKSDGSYFT